MRKEKNFDRREFEVDNSFVETERDYSFFFFFWIFLISRAREPILFSYHRKQKLNYLLKLSRTTWKISILINPLHRHPPIEQLQKIYKQSDSAPTRSCSTDPPYPRESTRGRAFPPFIFNLPLHSPLHGNKRAKRTGREWGLTRVIFDPRNRSRSTSPPVYLAVDSSDYLHTCRYACRRRRGDLQRYVRTAPNHLVKTCK